MKNKKGFTLIEIIVCLVLITAIGTGVTVTILKKDDNPVDKKVTERIILAASTFIETEKDEYGNYYSKGIVEGGQGVIIPLTDLLNKGYLSDSDYEVVKTSIPEEKERYVVVGYNSEDDCQSHTGIKLAWVDTTTYVCSYTKGDDPEGETELDPCTYGSCDLISELVKKYSVNENIPNFKLKSPKEVSGTNKYREKIENVTFDPHAGSGRGFKYNEFFVKYGYIYTIKPLNHSLEEFKDGKSLGNYNYNLKRTFGKSYIFDTESGKYTLTDTTETYIQDLDPNSTWYACGYDYNESCEEKEVYDGRDASIKVWWSECNTRIIECDYIYEISAKSCYLSAWNSDLEGSECVMVNGKKHSKTNAIDVGDSGLYKDYDNDGVTYYFRGAVTNNYVKLKNGEDESELFQIVRFNGDGSIRLMATEGLKNNSGNLRSDLDFYTSENCSECYKKYDYVKTETTKTIKSKSIITKAENNITRKLDNPEDAHLILTSTTIDNFLKNHFDSGKENITPSNLFSAIKNTNNNWFNNNDRLKNEYYDEISVEKMLDSSCVGNYVIAYVDSRSFGYTFIRSIIQKENKFGDENEYLYKIIAYDSSTKKITLSPVSINVEIEESENNIENIQTALNAWIDSKMNKYNEFLVEGNFCYDNSIFENFRHDSSDEVAFNILEPYRRAYNRLKYTQDAIFPTYKCAQDNLVNDDVGLISADELIYAGSISAIEYCKNSDGNSCIEYELEEMYKANYEESNPKYKFYLDRNSSYYTMTPGYLLYSEGDYNFISTKHMHNSKLYLDACVGDAQQIRINELSIGLYPVINILGSVKVESGEGTIDKPYILTLKTE